MKRVLSFFVIYIGAMVFLTLAFATLFMFSCNLTSFVTGLSSSFFSLNFFMRGILTSVPLVCVIVHALFIFYLIRHPSKKILSTILYAALGALSWFIIIPADLNLISTYEKNSEPTRIEASSPGIFRNEENGVYYYSRIYENPESFITKNPSKIILYTQKNQKSDSDAEKNLSHKHLEDGKSPSLADGVFIDTTGLSDNEEAIIPFFGVEVKNESAFPYSDILIKNSLETPFLVTYPLAIYNALLTAASYATSLGFFAWLMFASLGLALLSVYGVQFLSSWKFANVISVICALALVVLVNYFYYMGILPDQLKDFSTKFANLTGLKDSFIVLVNLIFSAIFIIFGFFMGIYRFGTASDDTDEEYEE